MNDFQVITPSDNSRLLTYRITGESLPVEKFDFLELDCFDPSAIIDVLDGRRVGVICRNTISSRDTKAICDNFWRHSERYKRGVDAPAEYLGTYHYAKPTDLYLEQSIAANKHLRKLFDGIENPVARVRDFLTVELQTHGRTLRHAQHSGMEACSFVMRSWTGNRDFALAPHEDAAQCTDPIQAGFEIQDAAKDNVIGAVNVCLENGDGGLLRLWNIMPDDRTRRALGVEVTGSVYPPHLLESFLYLDLKVRPGDCYVFDGRFLHAVTNLESSSGAPGKRATIAFLMAHLGQSETITWT